MFRDLAEAETIFIACGLRRLLRDHGIKIVVSWLAARADLSQRRSFFIGSVPRVSGGPLGGAGYGPHLTVVPIWPVNAAGIGPAVAETVTFFDGTPVCRRSGKALKSFPNNIKWKQSIQILRIVSHIVAIFGWGQRRIVEIRRP